MQPDAGAMASIFQQLGSIAAVLGGFAFASAGALLAATEQRGGRAASLAVGAAVLAAVCFILSSLAWTLSSVRATGVASLAQTLPASTFTMHGAMSLVFELGALALLASLGLSGWVRSRRLGWFTTVVAGLATIGGFMVVVQFIA